MTLDRSTAPQLADVLAALSAREPIFHGAHYATRADCERATAPDFWEIGASGARYDRAFILDELDRRRAAGHVDPPLAADDFRCQELAPGLYLLTYTLQQLQRLTRRTTLWRRRGDAWEIVFHQGTVVAADDALSA